MDTITLRVMPVLEGARGLGYHALLLALSSTLAEEEALKSMMDHYHNGAIYLLHPSNKGNWEALDDFIREMKRLGYRFDTVDHIG